MKNKFVLIFAVFCSMQMIATNLVVENRSGKEMLQDVAVIGKWMYVGDNLQLLDKAGNVLAMEPLANIKRISFSEYGNTTAIEEVVGSTVLVYPNPTQDVLMIQGIEAQALRVYDLKGHLLKTGYGTQLNVSDLADGTYLLQVGVQVIRFIKR